MTGRMNREVFMLLTLVGIWAFFAWQEPVFLSSRNLSLLSVELAITATLALGMLLVLLPGQIDLSADVDEEVLANDSEERLEDNDQNHADAEGVEQARLVADQDRIDQMLHEVGAGEAQHGHQQSGEDGLKEQPGVASKQAREAAERPRGRGAYGDASWPPFGRHQEQEAGPLAAKLLA